MDDATYTALSHFAATWGFAYFIVVFAAAVAYALWPSRQEQFDKAAQMPLRED